MPYYAVANGNNIGIFTTWDECKNSVNGYKNALYKKFSIREEAINFIEKNNPSIKLDENKKQTKLTSFIKSNNNKKEENNFIPDFYVYTDGACSNNGKHNAKAGIGIFFEKDDSRNVSKKIEGKQTNNTAELSAIIETYYIIKNDILNKKNIAIVTDSEYSIKCVTTYGKKCSIQNWNNDIPNKELVKKAYNLYKNKTNIKFIHIKAHTNNTDIHSIGNFNADMLANNAIGVNNCPYNNPQLLGKEAVCTSNDPSMSRKPMKNELFAPNIKIYLAVPFIKKEVIKTMGGKWDKDKKKWFVYENNKNLDKIFTLFSKV